MDPRPLSERLRIASPCPMQWSEMEGDDRVRRCHACKLNVYSTAAMTSDEIEQLLCASDRVCMNVYRRSDGTLVTGDCSRLWAGRRDEAASLLKEGLSVLGLVLVAFIVLGLGAVVFFGDNIRRMYGASAGGIGAAPTITTTAKEASSPTKKKLTSISSKSAY